MEHTPPKPSEASPAPPPTRSGMDLTQGPIARTLIVFSLPIILQMSIQPIYGFIDFLFVAQLGPEALEVVTNAATFEMLVIMLAAGLSNGVASYVSRLVGKGDFQEADNAAKHSMIIMAAFSLAAIAVFYAIERTFFIQVLQLGPELFDRAHRFIHVIMLGNVTIMFFLIGANILRGEGNSMVPLLIALVSVGANLILAPLLIFGPDDVVFGLHIGWLGLDVLGGGLAIVLSRAVGCLMLIAYLMLGRSVWTLSLKNFHFRPRHLIEILRVGLPMLAVNLSAWVGSIIFIRTLNHYPGAVVVYGIGIRLDMLAVLPMIGLMMGVIAMVGQNYGAGRLDRSKRAAWIGAVYAAGFAIVMGLAFALFPEFWIGIFNKAGDPALLEIGRNYIIIVAFTYPFVAQVFVLGGAFQGLGKGMPPLVITASRFLLVAIPLLLLLSPRMQATGAWIAIAGSHVFGGLFAVAWLAFEFRRKKGMS